jgi:undecaprenyl-phosphate 4-deoxy-4-formamido-L-arabinose transferase
MPEKHTCSVVVPVYNAERTLDELTRQLGAVMPGLCDAFEVILVNDASRDGSWNVIRGLAAGHDWVRGINFMRNYGQHNALLAGVRAAQYEVVVTIDDDLEHPPGEIGKLLDKLDEGYDVVYGAPIRQQHGLLRDLASALTKTVLSGAMGAETARHISSFRAFRTLVRGAFETYRGAFVSIDVLLSWATTRFAYVRLRHDHRQAGASNYTFSKLVLHALNMLTGFSVWPLQMMSLIGFAFTLLGVAALALVIAKYLVVGGQVPGFSFLASLIAVFSGAQMFAFGIMGEYLARMHFRMMERPVYAVRETVGLTAERPSAAAEPQRADARP